MPYTEKYRRLLNRMGYYNYQNGLIFRHLNQEGGWNDHLGHCRNYILRAVDRIRPERISILGSGWLLDLPLAEMLESTKKICLIDIVHPPEVISQVAGFSNVELLEDDVTGGLIVEVWNKTGRNNWFRKPDSIAGISIPEYRPSEDPGLIISLNILTQLELLPADLLKKKTRINNDKLAAFRTEVQNKHLDFLKKYPSVIISDFEEVITSDDGTIEHLPTLLTLMPPGNSREEWTWDFDLKGGDYYNKRSVMKVMALTYNL